MSEVADVQQLTPRQLSDWLSDAGRQPPVLLDVREAWEYELCRIPGSLNMPMQSVTHDSHKFAENAPIVVICHHGVRSFQVAHFLERKGFERLFNLSGGVNAWAQTVDPSMPTY